MTATRSWVVGLAAIALIPMIALLESPAAAVALDVTATRVAVVPAADGSTVAINAVKLPFTPTIRGAGGQASVTVTLPDGAVPIRMSGVIKSTYAYEGTIVVTINGRRIGEVPARTGGPISGSASVDDIESGVLVVSMYASLLPQEDCFIDENSIATLTDSSITYSHPVTAPSTIGGFLSDGLSDLTVQIPAEATELEQEAGLDAVAALTHRFRPPTIVRLISSDEPVKSDFLHRTVTVNETPSGSAAASSETVGGTLRLSEEGYLLVTGSGDALTSTAVALADRALALVDSAVLENVSGTADWSPATGPTTLADLGTGTISLSGVGRVQSVFGIGQPSFGRPVSGFEISLRGVVTPLPPLATGRIDVLWNGTLAASRDMSDDTDIDIRFGIEADQLNRDNTVTVILSYVPPSGGLLAAAARGTSRHRREAEPRDAGLR